MKKISIITPTFNRAYIISKTIQSVIRQTYTEFEYIIVDDGSTDNTRAVIESFNDVRIKYIYIENSERGFARNIGIKNATGTYITFVDSDDYLLENHLSEAWSFIQTQNKPNFFLQGYQKIKKDGKLLSAVEYPKKNVILSLCKNNVAGLGTFIKREIIRNYLFSEDPNFKIAEDLYVWLRIAANHGIKFNKVITGIVLEHNLNTMNTLNPYHVLYCRDKLIDLLKQDICFNTNYSNCYPYLFASQTNLAIFAFTQQGEVKIATSLLIDLLSIKPLEILRKRTIVIIRNILRSYIKLFFNKIKNYLYEDIWSVAKLKTPIKDILSGQQNIELDVVPNLKNNYYADPFPTEFLGKTALLVEQFDMTKQIGSISMLTENNKNFIFEKKILSTSFHLSFPNNLTFNNRKYLLPESSQSEELCLYEFDTKGELKLVKKLLVKTKAIDPNIYYDGKLFWLSYTDGNQLTNGNLYLYYSDSIENDWKPHKMNPVVYNKSNARSAGKWFIEEGKLYRPTQNCKQIYGESIIINRIETLNPERFVESFVAEIKPQFIKNKFLSDPIIGIHTFNQNNNEAFVDIKHEIFTPIKLWRILKKKFSHSAN